VRQRWAGRGKVRSGAHPQGWGTPVLKPSQGMIRTFRDIAGTGGDAAGIALGRCMKPAAGAPCAIVRCDRMPEG